MNAIRVRCWPVWSAVGQVFFVVSDHIRQGVMRSVVAQCGHETIEGILSMEFSGQFGVIKTIPGFANAIAYFIDRLKLSEVMGTIAGDDTIMIIAREGVSKNLLAGIFSKFFKGLQHKIL